MDDPDKIAAGLVNGNQEFDYPPGSVTQGWTMRPVRSTTPPSRPGSTSGNTRNFSRPSNEYTRHQHSGSSSSFSTHRQGSFSSMVAPRPLRTDHSHKMSTGSDDLSGYHTPLSSSPITSEFQNYQNYQNYQQHQQAQHPHHNRQGNTSISSTHSSRQPYYKNVTGSDSPHQTPKKSSSSSVLVQQQQQQSFGQSQGQSPNHHIPPGHISNWQTFKYPSSPPSSQHLPPKQLSPTKLRNSEDSHLREVPPPSIHDDAVYSSASSSSLDSQKNFALSQDNSNNEDLGPLPTQSLHNIVKTASGNSSNNSDSDKQIHEQQKSQQTQQSQKSQQSSKQHQHHSQPSGGQQQQPPGHQKHPSTSTPRAIRPIKICRQCGKSISGQFVRALDASFHIDCFCCADCGNLCSAKFFPVDSGNGDGLKVPLCEFDYFRRLDLLCFDCNKPLRGSYITAIGRKYHIEHFRCSVCSVILGPEDTYYEHEDSVLCHYHYSTLHAAKCEGCQTAILKQFVEIYRGGKEFQWHAECYMIFKFWNVKLSPPPSSTDPDVPTYVGTPLYELTEDQVFKRERDMEDKVFRIWTVLCGYEEVTASCISDMLQHASSGAYKSTLLAVCKLVFNIGVLFNALDELGFLIEPYIRPDKPKDGTDESNVTDTPATTSTMTSATTSIPSTVASPSNLDGDSDDEDQDDLFKALRREPKTLCKKLVSFMSLVSKAREKGNSQMDLSQDLLNLVTSLAHYLKILLRYGLSNCLHYDQRFCKPFESKAVDLFLTEVQKYADIPDDDEVLSVLKTSALSSDHCVSCGQSVEDKCVHYRKRQWHLDCLNCTVCRKPLGNDLHNARWDVTVKKIVCSTCAPIGSLDGFTYTTKLGQYIVLLKIAVARLQLVLNAFDARDAKAGLAGVSADKKGIADNDGRKQSTSDSSAAAATDGTATDSMSSERGYMTTLRDIRRLRSTKLDKRLSQSSHKARRSVILDMPPSEHGLVNDNSGGENSGATAVQQNHAKSKKAQAEEEESKSASSFFFKKKKKETRQLKIQEDSNGQQNPGRTTDLFKNDKSLTLDDIPRIVAAERARELQPNSFKHRPPEALSTEVPVQKNLQERQQQDTIFISELSDKELSLIKRLAVLKLHGLLSAYFSLDELMDLVEVKKNTSIWEKMGKAFGTNRKGKSGSSSATGVAGNVFGVPLDVLTEKHGVDSTLGVGPSSLRIPAFIDDCIQSMRQKDMSVEGIFRKNGNIRRLKEYTEKIDKNPDQGGILVEENAIQLAALLKKFLREMPEPLMISRLQRLWITAQKMPDLEKKKQTLHMTCLLLPKIHRDVMEVLFYFLNWVASFAHIDEESGSKMDTHNLATVITPNILYDKEKSNANQGSSSTPSPADNGDAYFLSIESVYLLIEDQQMFAQVPYDIWAIFKAGDFTENMTTKEFISKYEEISQGSYKNPQMQSQSHSNPDVANNSGDNLTRPQMTAKANSHQGNN